MTIDDLKLIIGEQQITIRKLQSDIANLNQALKAKEAKPEKKKGKK